MRYYLPLLWLLLPVATFAQLKLGQKAVDERDYAAAKIAFEQALQHPEEQPLAWLQLARFYIIQTYDRQDPYQAYTYIRQSRAWWNALPQKDQDRWNKRQNYRKDLLRTTALVERKLVAAAKDQPGITALKAMLDNYPDLSKRRLTELRNAYQDRTIAAGLAASDWATTGDYYNQLLPTSQPTPARQALEDSLLHRYLRQEGWSRTLRFILEYPRHLAAVQGYLVTVDTILQNDRLAKAIDFIRAHRTDIYGYRVYEQLSDLALRSDDLLGLRAYLKAFTQDRITWSAIYRHYLTRYRQQHPGLAALIAFRQAHPDYPYPGELTQALGEARSELPNMAEQLSEHPTSIGESINEAGSAYHAVLTADGNTLYFCGIDWPQGLGGEDIYSAHRTDSGWSKPRLERKLSAWSQHAAPLSISADGTLMLLYLDGKIFSTKKTQEGWSPPRRMPEVINEAIWQSDARITADGQAILFSRRGSDMGDLQVCPRQADGSWGEAISLGLTVNTDQLDRSPFLHPDGRTLYFSSAGHGSTGQGDIFVSRRRGEGWTQWSPPQRIATSVNTVDHEWDFQVTLDGRVGVFTRDAMDKSQIYAVLLPQKAQAEAARLIRGRVVDTKGQGIGATIVWQLLDSEKELQYTHSDPMDGQFVATLPGRMRGRVAYRISQKGYFPASGVIELSEQEVDIVLEQPLTLTSVADLQAARLHLPIDNLFFDSNHYVIQSASRPGLRALAAFLADNELCVEIAGHTDEVGSSKSNQYLSEKRAEAVRAFLIEQGLSPDCLSAHGYGETQPITDNTTAVGRAQNRRVEIRLRQQ